MGGSYPGAMACDWYWYAFLITEKNQFNWKFSIKQNQKGFKCAHIVFWCVCVCVYLNECVMNKRIQLFLKLFDVFG